MICEGHLKSKVWLYSDKGCVIWNESNKFYLIKLNDCHCDFNSHSVLCEVGAQKVFDESFLKNGLFFKTNTL